jgi:DNA-binding NtrC family response regulator
MNDLRILVVEDDLSLLRLIEKRLEMADYEVVTAKDGVEAVDRLSKSYFDVVITNLMLPGGVNGMGVLEAAKARKGHTEVILMTGYASVDNAVEAIKKGASDYLQKPLHLDKLMFRLKKISRLKMLAKDVLDLREAMDVTESSASQTIQKLEMTVSQLQNRLSEIKKVLSRVDLDIQGRVETALEALSSSPGLKRREERSLVFFVEEHDE